MSESRFMQRVGDFFRRIARQFNRRTRSTASYEVDSKFKRFYESMDSDDVHYAAVRQAAGLCDDALRVAKRRARLGLRLHELAEQLQEVEGFNNLTAEDAQALMKLLDYFMTMSNERTMLLNKLTDFDPSLGNMFKLEDEAKSAVAQIRNAETNQRMLKQDLGYLQGEKEYLILENETMSQGLLFIRRFTMGILALFVLIAILLGYIHIAYGRDIFWPTAFVVMLAIGTTLALVFFRRRLRFEKRLNYRKQRRAVSMLNTKNVVYAYYTNYVRYSYQKYKVRNSQMLAHNLEDFEKYKYVLNRIDTVRAIMYETEAQIEDFIREKRLSGIRGSVENYARTINLENKKRYYDDLVAAKQEAEQELATLDTRHEEIWHMLDYLNEKDVSEKKIIDTIIKTYLDEAARVFDDAGLTEQLEENKENEDERTTGKKLRSGH